MTKILLSIILILCVFTVFSQNSFYGKITDSDNNSLPFAHIFLKNNRIGTSSQIDGSYQILINDYQFQYDTLIISYMGYKTINIPVFIEDKQKFNFCLTPHIENLEAIVVTADKPKYTAAQIIKKARRKLGKNYFNKSSIQEGFYREKLMENGICLKINECSFDFKTTPYPSPEFSKKSFHEYWDDFYNNQLSGEIFSQFSQFWPLFITQEDQVNIVESRVSNESSSLDGKYEKIGDPLGGPIDLIGLNNIKYKLDFLNPKLTKKYLYKIEDIKLIDSVLCYLISYYPKQDSFKYFHRYDKKVRHTLFKGNILIRMGDFAILSFTAESLNWQSSVNTLNKDSKYFLTSIPNVIKYQVDFQETTNGLILKSIKYEANHQSVFKNNSNYKWYREINLSKPTIKSFEEGTIAHFPTRHRTLRQRTTSYNKIYWKNFENSTLYLPLSNQEKSDLEYQMPLEQQFNLLNQKVKDILPPVYTNEDIKVIEAAESQNEFKDIFNNHLKRENDYANKVLQKLNEYERDFQPYRILHKDLSKTTLKSTKSKYFRQVDSLRNYHIYEMINDSLSKAVFNITHELKHNTGGKIQGFKFSRNHVFIDIKKTNKLSHILKVKKKGDTETLDSIDNINEFEVINDSLLLYTVFNNNRPSELYLHTIGNSKSNDKLLLDIQDIEHDIELSQTTSERFIVIDITSKDQNEIWTFDTYNLNLQLVFKRENKKQIKIDHFTTQDFYTTLISGIEYNLLTTNITSLISDTIINTKNRITDYYLHQQKLLYTEYKNFNIDLYLVDLQNKSEQIIKLQKGINYIEFLKEKGSSEKLSVTIESVIRPIQEYSINLQSGEHTLIDEQKYSYSSQKSSFHSEVINVSTKDGIEIPVLIYYDNKAIKDSVTALLIHAYGAYGGIIPSLFDDRNITLLKKGIVIAEPAIRGSGVKGLSWYADGKLMNKKNSFEDFINVTRYLKNKFNIPSKRVFAKGISAGGLVMGYMVNNYSSDYGGIILDRAFLDVFNSMMDSTKYLTTIEYQEWGNPRLTESKTYLESYSPYQNITKKSNCNLFFRASEYDFITPSSQSLKSVIKYRNLNKPNHLILLKTRENQGHLVRDINQDIAEEYAFIMYTINN